MLIKGVIFEDFINYKKPSMVIEFPFCSFKCGIEICQNANMKHIAPVEISINSLIDRYLDNLITEAIVMQGLEPFDSFEDLINFIELFRKKSNDDIVIYTGYNLEEVKSKIIILKNYSNIIVKFGRYIPNQESHYDEELGVYLSSNNQFAINLNNIEIDKR